MLFLKPSDIIANNFMCQALWPCIECMDLFRHECTPDKLVKKNIPLNFSQPYIYHSVMAAGCTHNICVNSLLSSSGEASASMRYRTGNLR